MRTGRAAVVVATVLTVAIAVPIEHASAHGDGHQQPVGTCSTLVGRPDSARMTESIVVREPGRIRVVTKSTRPAGAVPTVTCAWVDLDGDGAYDAGEPSTERRSKHATWSRSGNGSKYATWLSVDASASDSICVRTARARNSSWEVSPVACDVPAPAPEIPEVPVVPLFGISAIALMAFAAARSRRESAST